jgi:hypothetical protein
LALYGLRFASDALIPVAASSRDQARIMYRQAKGFLRRSSLNDPGFEFEAFDGYRRIDVRGPGRTKRGEVLGSIEIHAADAGTGDGIIPFPYAFLDELHRHRSLDLYETWRGKLDKRDAQIVTISTPASLNVMGPPAVCAAVTAVPTAASVDQPLAASKLVNVIAWAASAGRGAVTTSKLYSVHVPPWSLYMSTMSKKAV